MKKTVNTLPLNKNGYVRLNDRLMGVGADGRLWMLKNTPCRGYNDGGPCLLIRFDSTNKWHVELESGTGSFQFTSAEPPNGQVVFFTDFKIGRLTTPEVPAHLVKK